MAYLRRRVESCGGSGSYIAALSTYLSDHEYSSVLPNDLINSLIKASPTCLSNLMFEASPLLFSAGVPLVTAAWVGGDPASKRLLLTQSRFFASSYSAALANAPTIRWTLPILVTAGNASTVLKSEAAAIAQEVAKNGGLSDGTLGAVDYNPMIDGWISFTNATGGDYFRVQLPIEALDAFADALVRGDSVIPPPDSRAAIVDDLFALGESLTTNTPSITYALGWLLRWGKNETAPAVRTAIASRINRIFYLLTDDVPLSANGNPNILPSAAIPGTNLYSCTQNLLAYASAVGISRSTILSLNASVAGVNRQNLAASLSAGLDAVSASSALSRVATGASRDIAWLWMSNNWNNMQAWYGYRSTLASTVRTVTRSFRSFEYADAVSAFFSNVAGATPVVDGTWQRSIESIHANAGWASSTDATNVCAYLADLSSSNIFTKYSSNMDKNVYDDTHVLQTNSLDI